MSNIPAALLGLTLIASVVSCSKKLQGPWLKRVAQSSKLVNFKPSPLWRSLSWLTSRAIMTSVSATYARSNVTIGGKLDHSQPYLVVPNHVSYMDGWMLNFFLHDGWNNFKKLNFHDHFWTATSAHVCFRSPASALIAALGKAVPIQGRFQYDVNVSGDPALGDIQALNELWLSDMADLIVDGSRVLYFPEGRIWQEDLEQRDGQGRLVVQYDSSEQTRLGCEPFENTGPFYWGVAKVVARSNCKVVPAGHFGNQLVVPCGERNSLDMSKVRWSDQRVHIEIGEPIDFSELIDKFKSENKISGPITGESPAELELYRIITRKIRMEVVNCERKARSHLAIFQKKC